jgi:hypothetical protein
VPLVPAVGRQAARLLADRLLPGGQHAVRVPAVPAPVLRGVGLAAVAAVGVSGGAVALVDATGSAPAGASTRLAVPDAVVPAPTLVAAGRSVLTVPVPEVATAAQGADGTLLDPAALSRAVARAQADARRFADKARVDEGRAVATQDGTEERAEDDDEDADEDERSAEERRTADRAERVGRAADPERTAPEASAACDLDTGQLGAVKPHVRTAAEFLGCAFDEPTVLGVAGRAGTSDHPRGRALDFMVDRVTGDRLAACALRNREELGISYVIWRQRIDTGSGFRAMADRGGATANHFDHVHVSFEPDAGTGDPLGC